MVLALALALAAQVVLAQAAHIVQAVKAASPAKSHNQVHSVEKRNIGTQNLPNFL
ncbi:hypothetical protein [Nitrososphaera sp. AFS]|uniref:hypothetical protein n=1 Tax=Nitrososphaera sp. AFS TaxID=2301191 RepID=UPI00191701DF|nr:hypothetical protein [Nitrososphaera sp. AFS]